MATTRATTRQADAARTAGTRHLREGEGSGADEDGNLATVDTQTAADLQQMAAYADLPMDIEAELDQRSISVQELLNLAPGSVLKLTRSAGENVDVRVNNARIGFGEIVILENKVGVRITDFDTL